MDAIKQSRVYFHIDLPRTGKQRVPWPACFQGQATGQDNPRAFVWTGSGGVKGQDALRLFDDGNILFERQALPRSRPGDLITVDFNTLAEDTMGFV
jgi:hypothetical protein